MNILTSYTLGMFAAIILILIISIFCIVIDKIMGMFRKEHKAAHDVATDFAEMAYKVLQNNSQINNYNYGK